MTTPFNINQAKAGHPVQTRDGRRVRIICWDRKDKRQPIVALVETEGGKEVTKEYSKNGSYFDNRELSPFDLFMAPKKHEGWTNIYPVETLRRAKYTAGIIYNTEVEARRAAGDGVLATIHIGWEE